MAFQFVKKLPLGRSGIKNFSKIKVLPKIKNIRNKLVAELRKSGYSNIRKKLAIINKGKDTNLKLIMLICVDI